MKLHTYAMLVLSIAALIGISGCARYAAKPLNRLTVGVTAPVQKSSISFTYRVFTKSDCKRYLDRDVLAKGYQPVQITLTNNSSRTLNISLNSFSFPCVDSDEVAKKVHTSTVSRAVGYGVLGLFIWPFLIPAVVDGVGSHDANKELDADFLSKSLQNQIVQPYSTINGLVYVPRGSFHEDFTFTVTDSANNQSFELSAHDKVLKV